MTNILKNKTLIMKKLLLTVLLAVTVARGAFATPKEVNSAILARFEAEFKKASAITWVVTADYTKAAFTADYTKMEAYYNAKGDIIATSKSINPDELPADAKRSFAKKFADYNIIEAIRFEGFDEAAYYISGENEKETVILKVDENNRVTVFKKTKNK
jgi:hypothetical protein